MPSLGVRSPWVETTLSLAFINLSGRNFLKGVDGSGILKTYGFYCQNSNKNSWSRQLRLLITILYFKEESHLKKNVYKKICISLVRENFCHVKASKVFVQVVVCRHQN
jgi:hypothetical protein